MAWVETQGALEAEFRFRSFRAAMAFLNEVADLAESHNHHPEIFNSYCRVKLRLTTHDQGSIITDKDWQLASAIDDLLSAT